MAVNNPYYLLFSILIVQKRVFSEEITTFQRGNNVTCVLGDVTVPIFLSPPSFEENFQRERINLFTKGKWTEDDWSPHVGDDLTPGFIDKRWQDLPTLYIDYLSFENTTTASFSVYGPIEFTLFMTEGDITRSYDVKIQHAKSWTHCSIVVQNTKVLYQQDRIHLRKWHNFKPDKFIIKSATTTYWKKHSYQFKLSHSVTTSTPTALTIPASRIICLLLYTLLCRTCFLEVLILNNPSSKTNFINLTNNQVDITNRWQIHVMEIQQDKDTHIQFYRNGSHTDGLWAIDVRMCPTTFNNLYAYTTTLSTSETRECRILENKGKIQNKGTKSDNIDPINNNTATCKPGFVGLHCNISCATVLGRRFTYCEEHRICQASKCTCSWGYEGRLCQDRCGSDKWGLSCHNECTLLCPECDKITGACIKQLQVYVERIIKHFLENIVISCVLIVAVIAAILMKFYVLQEILAPVVDIVVGLCQRVRREDMEESEESLVLSVSFTTSL